jgi:hypothetical protein
VPAAAGHLEARKAPEVPVGRLQERVAALPIEVAGALDVCLVLAGCQEAGESQLAEVALCMSSARFVQEALANRPTRRDPPDPHPAPCELRERVDVDHVAAALRAQRARVLAREAQVAVDAVLENEEAVLPGELEQAVAPLRREIAAGRVVTARLESDQPDLLPRQQLLERVDVETALIDRDGQHSGPGLTQRLEHAHEAR